MNQLTLVKDMTKNLLGINQYDVGQSLKILTGASGIDLTSCIMQWSYAGLPVDTTTDNRTFVADGDTALTVAGVCRIPDAALAQAGQVTGYIYQTIDDVSETVMTVTISPTPRTMPSDYVSDDNVVSLTALIQSVVSDMAPSGLTIVTSFDDLPETADEGTQCGVLTYLSLISGSYYNRLSLRTMPDLSGLSSELYSLSLTKGEQTLNVVFANDSSLLNDIIGMNLPVNSPAIVMIMLDGLPIFIWVSEDIADFAGVSLLKGWNKTTFGEGGLSSTQDFIMPSFLEYVVTMLSPSTGDIYINKVLESKYVEMYTRCEGEWVKNVTVDNVYQPPVTDPSPATFTAYQVFEDTDINRVFISSLNANQINLYNAGVLTEPTEADNVAMDLNDISKAHIEAVLLPYGTTAPIDDALSTAIQVLVLYRCNITDPTVHVHVTVADYDDITHIWSGNISVYRNEGGSTDFAVYEAIRRTDYQASFEQEEPS